MKRVETLKISHWRYRVTTCGDRLAATVRQRWPTVVGSELVGPCAAVAVAAAGGGATRRKRLGCAVSIRR